MSDAKPAKARGWRTKATPEPAAATKTSAKKDTILPREKQKVPEKGRRDKIAKKTGTPIVKLAADDPDKPLTARQQAFVEQYLVDLNACQAAIRAGYSAKTAKEIASENLTKPNIANAIQKLRAKVADKLGITRERVMQEYARLAFVDPRAFYNADGSLKNVPDMDADTAAALVGFEVDEINVDIGDGESKCIGVTKKIKWSDKKGALDSINRMMGWNQDKLKVQGDPNAPIEVRTKVVIVPPKTPAVVIARTIMQEED